MVQHYEDEHAYTDQDLELLTSIGSQTALAIEQKRAESEVQQQAERVAVTNRISQAVRRTLDVSEVFETAVREMGQHLEVDRCSLYMKDEKAGRVTNAAEFHVADVEPAGTDFDLPRLKGLTESMEKHGVMAFDDVAGDERSRGLYGTVVKRDVKSIMYVGVTVGRELLGAFALSTTKAIRRIAGSPPHRCVVPATFSFPEAASPFRARRSSACESRGSSSPGIRILRGWPLRLCRVLP